MHLMLSTPIGQLAKRAHEEGSKQVVVTIRPGGDVHVRWSVIDGENERLTSVSLGHLSEIGEPVGMTTDADEGRRQIEAMKPEPLKVGDKVRLKAGGEWVMTVVRLEDYGNMVVCVPEPASPGIAHEYREAFPAGSLVRV